MSKANPRSTLMIEGVQKVDQRGYLRVPITMLRAAGLDRGSQLWIEVVNETTLAISRLRPTTGRPHYPAQVNLTCGVYLCTDLRAQVKLAPRGAVELRVLTPAISAQLTS